MSRTKKGFGILLALVLAALAFPVNALHATYGWDFFPAYPTVAPVYPAVPTYPATPAYVYPPAPVVPAAPATPAWGWPAPAYPQQPVVPPVVTTPPAPPPPVAPPPVYTTSGKSYAGWFNWFKKFPTCSTPQLPGQYNNGSSAQSTVNIWVKKDWGSHKETNAWGWGETDVANEQVPIRIELYKEGANGEDILVTAKTTPDIYNVPLLSYGAYGPSFGAPVQGRNLYEFKNLPKYDSANKPIVYKVKEVVPEGYVLVLPEEADQASLDENGAVVVTNDTRRVEYFNGFYYIVRLQNEKVTTPGSGGPILGSSRAYTVTKIWDDASNAAGERPETLQDALTLKATVNGETVDVSPTGYTLVAEEIGDEWTYSFVGLPRNKDGEPIKYSVEEASIPGYRVSYSFNESGSAATITNTYALTGLTVTKTWAGENGNTEKRPATLAPYLTLKASADGIPQSVEGYDIVEDKTVSADTWTYTYTRLPKYTEEGVLITYSVEEVQVPGYTVPTYAQDGAAISITNTLAVWDEKPPVPDLPPEAGSPLPTAETFNLWIKKDWGSSAVAQTAAAKSLKIEIWKSVAGSDELALVKSTSQVNYTDANRLTYTVTNGKVNYSFAEQVPGRNLYEFKNLSRYDADGNLITYYVREVLPEGISYELNLPAAIDRDAFDPQTGLVEIDYVARERIEWAGDFYYVVIFQNRLTN